MNRYYAGKKILYIMIICNIFLAVLKIGTGFFVGSSGLIADGFHSFSDIISSVGILIAIKISSIPPDSDHHYGHGQAEPIAAKLLGIVLLFTGGVLAYSTVIQLLTQEFEVLGLTGFWIAVISIVIKEIMFRYSYKTGAKTDNQALKADAWHHRSDAISSVAAAAGILGSYFGYPYLDPIAGLIVSLMIIKIGLNIIMEAVNSLMASSPEKEKLDQIKDKTRKIEGVKDVVELKAHYTGIDIYVDLKILVDSDLTVMEGHQIAAEVKQKIFSEIPEIKEVLVHVDPVNEK